MSSLVAELSRRGSLYFTVLNISSLSGVYFINFKQKHLTPREPAKG